MEEEVKMQLEFTNESMNNAISHLVAELARIRAGKANVSMLDGIFIDYYGANTPLSQVANINTPDPKMIVIQPWEKSIIGTIEKAIQKANIGINPQNDGEIIRLAVPPLTEERRRDLVKQVKNEGEHTKVSIRNSRREANDEFKTMKKEGLSEDMEKDAEAQVQALTDKYITKVDELVAIKEKDIMTI
ncbi:MAG: ribosome recycling factor [Bacteroidales bacterium]|nr:ribosome recycling factor [Bacteroidales bacterium]MCF8455767.1 ribosome recycling factor [Bacteroidales bacterium]